MTSIRKDILIEANPGDVWAAIRDAGAVHQRLAAGFVTHTQLAEDARIVTFANGLVARELLVDINDETRRFVYAAVGGQLTHHNASMQVFANGPGQTRLVWITDMLPDDIAEHIAGFIDQGAEAIQRTLQRGT